MNTPEVDTERLKAELNAHIAPRGGDLSAWVDGLSEAERAYVVTLIGAGVGTLTLPAGCLVAGRSVRVQLSGYYVEGQ